MSTTEEHRILSAISSLETEVKNMNQTVLRHETAIDKLKTIVSFALGAALVSGADRIVATLARNL